MSGTKKPIDDNIAMDDSGQLSCIHCDTDLGHRDGAFLEKALHREHTPTSAGPQIHVAAETFINRSVVMRQTLCPGCLAALRTEIVPVGDADYRTKIVRAIPTA